MRIIAAHMLSIVSLGFCIDSILHVSTLYVCYMLLINTMTYYTLSTVQQTLDAAMLLYRHN